VTQKNEKEPHPSRTRGGWGILFSDVQLADWLIAGYCAAFAAFFLGSAAGAGFQNVGSPLIVSGPT
jgi:hypothetical protein